LLRFFDSASSIAFLGKNVKVIYLQTLTLGLEFDPALVEDGIKVNHKTPFDNTPSSIVYIITGLIDRNVVEEWIVNPTTEQLETKPVKFEDLHESVKARWRDCTDYRPRKLSAYASHLDQWAMQHPSSASKLVDVMNV
jgi:hypothetical protein